MESQEPSLREKGFENYKLSPRRQQNDEEHVRQSIQFNQLDDYDTGSDLFGQNANLAAFGHKQLENKRQVFDDIQLEAQHNAQQRLNTSGVMQFKNSHHDSIKEYRRSYENEDSAKQAQSGGIIGHIINRTRSKIGSVGLDNLRSFQDLSSNHPHNESSTLQRSHKRINSDVVDYQLEHRPANLQGKNAVIARIIQDSTQEKTVIEDQLQLMESKLSRMVEQKDEAMDEQERMQQRIDDLEKQLQKFQLEKTVKEHEKVHSVQHFLIGRPF